MADSDALDLALALLRVGLGAMIFAHGWNHLVGGLDGTGSWFASMGLRPGKFHALLASITELGAGVLLVLGLLTPLGCAGLAGVAVVAWIVAHRKNGFFIFAPGQGWEYVMMLTVTALALAALGPGRWSLDEALEIAFSPAAGLITATLAGLGGAALLLAIFWRPGGERQS